VQDMITGVLRPHARAVTDMPHLPGRNGKGIRGSASASAVRADLLRGRIARMLVVPKIYCCVLDVSHAPAVETLQRGREGALHSIFFATRVDLAQSRIWSFAFEDLPQAALWIFI